MRYLIPFSAIVVCALTINYFSSINQEEVQDLEEKINFAHEESKSPVPNEHWYNVRSYPNGFDEQEYIQKINSIKADALPMYKAVELGLNWLSEGPGNIGGRFNALAMSPSNSDIIYAGAANGGIFKTIDGGTNWVPIFDDYAFLAIGEIELDPTNENTVYVGTGDKNFGGGSHLGNGLYRSTDGGTNWTQLGLEETAIITEIVIDPIDPNRIFVSTLGNTYEKTTERGIYRTTDGGSNWQNILFISDSSGVVDLIMDPLDSDILYASGFNRINLPFDARVSGPDANIYKTTDGGDNWVELTTGLPAGDHSRIGLAISNDNSDVLYALYVDDATLDVKDIYKTADAGSSWTALNVHSGGLPPDALGGFGWYFGEVYMNPYNNNQLIVPGVDMFMSLDGGVTWTQNVPDWFDYEVHADKHAIQFLNATSYIIGTDGGLYETNDNGINWTDIENIPVTQFYHIDVDKTNSGTYGGGAQDNGSMSGNFFSANNWVRLYGGDGFRMTFLENDFAYYETQKGGLHYYNYLTGTYLNLSPQIFSPDRVNWDMPYMINESTSELFAGSSQMWKMAAAPYGIYEPISDDLTKVATGSFVGDEHRHTITEIEQSHFNLDKLFVGTSDGLVWKGEKDGWVWDWTDITGTLPDRYVTVVCASPNFDNTIYVGFSGYKLNEQISYLYRSDDDGLSWIDVSGDLPGITVNDIFILPGHDDDYIFAALDGGVYFTEDGGAQWDYVGTSLPFATISELDMDYENEKLIAGTYSRSMWSYDVSWIDDLDDPSVLEEEFGMEKIRFFPNPVEDLVYFIGLQEEHLDLYDAKGTLVLHKRIQQFESYAQVNLAVLSSGVYYFRNGSKQGKLVKR